MKPGQAMQLQNKLTRLQDDVNTVFTVLDAMSRVIVDTNTKTNWNHLGIDNRPIHWQRLQKKRKKSNR